MKSSCRPFPARGSEGTTRLEMSSNVLHEPRIQAERCNNRKDARLAVTFAHTGLPKGITIIIIINSYFGDSISLKCAIKNSIGFVLEIYLHA